MASRSGWTLSAATLITSGELKCLIEEDGLRGLASNLSIFEKAIAGSSDYREQFEAHYSVGASYGRN